MFEYTPILVYLIFGLIFSALLLIASYFVAIQNKNLEKFSPYECGFQPFEDARQEFDVRFYVIAILFLIFDLEIAYLFPWAVSLSVNGYWSMVMFLGILTIGFIYEWRKGGLDWSSSFNDKK
jgi:NADH-quinone oxidoreductase subunit A